MGDQDISDEAVRRATGRGWDAWFTLIDAFPEGLGHTQRAKHLAEAAPELSGWWRQMVTVQYERERGLRVVGQSHRGDHQVGCSKTYPLDSDTVWARLLDHLGAQAWQEGDGAHIGDEDVTVRRIDAPSKLRWHVGDGSIVDVDLEAKPGRTTLRFRHHRLPDADARETRRAQWKAVLADLAD